MNCQDCNRQTKLMSEVALAMAERTIRRLWITILVLIVMMTGMAVGFFAYEAQFEEYTEYSDYEAEVDAIQLGDDNMVAGGDITYAVSESPNP